VLSKPSATNSNQGKKGLFDDDDEADDNFFSAKKPTQKPKA
jgi:hypothetical protein